MYPLWQMRQGLSFDDSAASKGCRGSGSERMAKLYRMRTLCGRLPYRCSRTFRDFTAGKVHEFDYSDYPAPAQMMRVV